MHTGAGGKGMSLDARGKFGYSGGFGRIAFGYTRLGFYSWWAGTYQKRYYYGKPYISRGRFYRPSNPQTELQQLWRSQVASGWTAWFGLDFDQKNSYKMRAKNFSMSGANLFMREWLNSHKSVLS